MIIENVLFTCHQNYCTLLYKTREHQLGVGDMAKILNHVHENHDFITIFFHVGFTNLQVTEHYSQTYVPI